MKKLIILAAALCSMSVFGQATTAYKVYLKDGAEVSPYRNDYFFKAYTNIGTVDAGDLYTQVKEKMTTKEWDKNAVWYKQPFFRSTNNEADAQVIISASYQIKSETIAETKHYKREMPYSMTYPKHVSQAEVIRLFEYKDGTPNYTDTLKFENSSKEIPGDKFRTLKEVEASTISSVKGAFNVPHAPLEEKHVKILFPTVKIKDKALKAEYATVQSLLKDNKFAEAGAICQKVLAASKSPEASAALGLCYELAGNYPKAEQYTKPLPDFHIKSRMRKNIALLNYAKSIGYNPVYVEF